MEGKEGRIGAVYVVEERYTLWRGGTQNRKGLWRVNSGRRWGILEEVDGSSIQVLSYYLKEEDLKSQREWDFKHDKWGRQLRVLWWRTAGGVDEMWFAS